MLLLLFPGSGSPKVQLLEIMMSLCSTENTQKSKESHKLNYSMYLHFLKPFSQLKCTYYSMLSSR